MPSNGRQAQGGRGGCSSGGHRLAFALEELSPAGETGFNNDSPNHLNGTMMNHKREIQGSLRGITKLTCFGDQGERGWTRKREQLWDPGRVGGPCRKGIAVGVMSTRGWRAPDGVEELSSGSSAVSAYAKSWKD